MDKRILLIAIAAAAMMASCGKDKKDPVITITTQPAATVDLSLGGTERLTVGASATEGAALAYQWYSNTTASNTSGTEISGATTVNYDIPTTLAAGTYYYFCEARAQGAESKRSNITTVTVIDYSIFDVGVTIDGVTWATRNVGEPGKFAASPEAPGMLYQWGTKIGYLNTGTVTGWNTTPSTATSWEDANDPSPAGWRLPTMAELTALRDAPSEWTTVGGMDGRKIGTGANTVFLPAAGQRSSSNGALHDVGTWGLYWSNEQDGSSARIVYFSSDFFYTVSGANKTNAYSIRCVKK